jgi:N6-adenosine-specific RNA methylase IME4
VELTRELLAKLPMALRIEIEENALRKDLTQSELAQLQERMLSIVRQQSKQGQRTDLDATSGKAFPEVKQEPERATEAVGRLFGESGKQVHKRLEVVKAAKVSPEQFGKLKEDMDRTGHVNGPFKRLKVMRQAEAIRAAPPPLPGRGPYRVIVADPPWAYEIDGTGNANWEHRATKSYITMPIEQMCAMDISSITHEDCILWLWTTNAHMRNAFAVVDAWGFTQKTILTWAKDKMGHGDWLRGKTEHCLMAVRGKPIVELTNQTTLLEGKRRANSQKPVEFYDFVERLCPSPRYAYLFSRYSHNQKWDCHGDEAPK